MALQISPCHTADTAAGPISLLAGDPIATSNSVIDVATAQPTLPAILNDKIERAAAFARAARASSARRAYDSDWAIFTAWCTAHCLVALPATPDVVAVFASDQAAAGRSPSTINRRVAAIRHHYCAAGFPAPTALPTAGRGARRHSR